MGIGKRIREARENLGFTQKELAEIIGVTGPAITNYESETSHPKEPILYKLMDALHVDANFLFQDMMNDIPNGIRLSLGEENHLKKYRQLTDQGRRAIDDTIDVMLAAQPEPEKIVSMPQPNTHKALRIARSSDDHGPTVETLSDADIAMLQSAPAIASDDAL